MSFPKGMKHTPTVTLEVRADGSFTAGVEDSIYEGKLDRDVSGFGDEGFTWKRKPRDKWTRQAIAQAASFLVGLTPRL
jgi:hypothetical protein